MRPGQRFGLSAMQKSELWRRWKAGQSLHEIGRAFGKSHGSIRCVVSLHGGFVPAVRRRSLRALTLPEREDISRGIASGSSLREIAKLLDRAVSTVSREVVRHGGRSEYRANAADDQAWQSASRPKPCRLALCEQLQEMVASKLLLDWSPEQISGWLTTQYPSDENMRVSHETTYRSLFIQARGVLKKELVAHLRSKRRIRRSQHACISSASGENARCVLLRTGRIFVSPFWGTPWWPHKMVRYHLVRLPRRPASVESVGIRFVTRIQLQVSALPFFEREERPMSKPETHSSL